MNDPMTDRPTFELDFTHDPHRTSWVESARGHASFPIQNLPWGVFSPPGDGAPRAGVAIGAQILDLRALAASGLLPEAGAALAGPTLNALFGGSAATRRALRRRLSTLLGEAAHRDALSPLLHDATACETHLPATIGDYTDFYVGIHHARNIGGLYRPDDPLTPNYKHLPVGYHGRSSSVRVSGNGVRRPHGQVKPDGVDAPSFGISQKLDYELELALWVGPGNPLGEPIAMRCAHEHIVGLGLLNDWSARDLQAWERLPLGPFLGKSFATTVSPWVVTVDALAPFRMPPTERPAGDPRPLPYLQCAQDAAAGQFAIALQAGLLTPQMRELGLPAHRLSVACATDMYWTFAQLVAHHASNGCNLTAGDLIGTGTISGPRQGDSGSLMEVTRDGTAPVQLPSGEQRSYLLDGDELILQATASAPGYVSIGFGSCHARVEAARPYPA